VEINEKDRKEILDLFFNKMLKIEMIENHFKGKYSYREIKNVTRERIREYNGYTVETAKQTISRNKNKRT
jgi:hypothetical protein